MAESDWDTVTVLRKKGPSAAQAKSKQVSGGNGGGRVRGREGGGPGLGVVEAAAPSSAARRAHRAPSLFLQAILAAQRRGEDVETSKKCGYPAGRGRSGLGRLPGMVRGGRRRHRPAEPTIPNWAVTRSPERRRDDASGAVP
ncbi:hypothetical protein Nmel_016871 [Mimus melanotis]